MAARLPIPGSDDNAWGDILNTFLSVEHNSDGTLKPSGSLATKADTSAVVHNTGNETVGGVKTFTASPLVPTPTTNSQAATKAYVDNAVGGGAVAPTVRAAYTTSGSFTFANTAGVWRVLTDTGNNNIEVDIPAAVGDWVEVSISGLMNPDAATFLDIGIVVGSTIVRYLGGGTSTPLVEGEPALYPRVNFRTFGYGTKGFTVTSNDRDGSNVRIAMVFKSTSGAGTFESSTSYPFYMRVLNLHTVS